MILGDVCSLFLETCLDVFVCFVSFLGVFFAFVLPAQLGFGWIWAAKFELR